MEPTQYHYKGCRFDPTPEPRCAWAVLIMIGKAYAPGALVVAQSLRAARTKHDLVCMVTADVPEETRDQLRLVFDRVADVPYVSHAARPLPSSKQAESYNGWIDRAFTKWNCLNLTDYDRVLFVDADIVFTANADELFDLRPPAACYSLPWAQPWQKKGNALSNPYIEPGACDMPHGAPVPATKVMDALRSRTFVGGGFLVLLEPGREKYSELLALIREKPVYGQGYLTTSRADECSIAELYAGQGTDWTHIHQRYAAIPWKKDWVSRDIRGFHYFGRKPWESARDEWPDLADWWKVADRLTASHPRLSALFSPRLSETTPLDADYAQFRLTNDLRTVIRTAMVQRAPQLRHGKHKTALREIDNILERWLLAMVNNPGSPGQHTGWAKVYRRSAPEEQFNQKLVAELAEKRICPTTNEAQALVSTMLALVAARLSLVPHPTGARESCGPDHLSYGSHFRINLTPRLRRLIELGGCLAATNVALRYAAVISAGQQWGLPQHHVSYLYETCGVRNEAFASPLNARLLGKPGARFCSIFPDVDGAFGSIGDFFSAEVGVGNWVINPPFVESLMTRMARRVVDNISPERPQTFFIILPAWTDSEAYSALHRCPHLAAEIRLTEGEYYFEDPSGNRIFTKASSIYFALSTEGPEVRQQLETALRTIMTI